MNKIIFLLALFCLIITNEAKTQVIYPINVTVVWGPSPSTDIISYTLTHNGTNFLIDATTCSLVECTKQIIVTSSAIQNLSVVSTNQWGNSIPVTYSFTAVAPGRSGNIKVRVGP